MPGSSFLAFTLYICIIIGIGILSTKKSSSKDSYILGGRGLNYWVTAISANASDMSVWLFMGLPMAIYQEGFMHIWTALGLVFFMFLNWHFIAPKLRYATEEAQCLTLPSFFAYKIGHKTRSLRLLGSLFSIIFLTIYVAAGITGMGYLFESIFGFNYVLGCLIAIAAILLYTSMGGFTAICYTDFFQGIFLLFVILLVPSLTLFNNANPNFISPLSFDGFWPNDQDSWFKALTLACGWGVGYFGQPHILNKFMAIKEPNELYKSKIIGTVWQVLALGGAVMVAIAAKSYFLKPAQNSETIFVEMVQGYFSPFLASFILCAILAATLSTIDSQILVIAGIAGEDLLPALSKTKVSDKKVLLYSRVASVFTCLIALSVALAKISSIHQLVNYCWVGMGSAFGPLVIASLYFKKLNKFSAIAGLLTGGLVGLLWILLDTSVSATIPGFLAGFLVIWLTNCLKAKNPKH